MYTILINDDNTTIASIKERIMERSNLMNTMRFLVNPKYTIEYQNGYDQSEEENSSDNTDITDESETESQSESNTTPIVVDGVADMSRFKLLLEYTRPISKKPKSEYLTLTTNEDGTPKTYKGKLEYKLPVTTDITKEHGEVQMSLTFLAVDLGVDGKEYQYIRKLDPISITVIPVSAWTDIVPDEAFAPLDQRLIQAEAQIKALEELNDISAITEADNITLDAETNTIALTANGEKIGDAISISELGKSLADNTDDGLIKMIVI